MSEEEVKTGVAGPWPVLNLAERRVLGVLVEKAKTTPDAYPLSLNALITGCNQKSNREPLLTLDEDDVLEALNHCRTKGLVCKVPGSRVERWRHLLYEQWHVNKVDLAILAELLLRGPQTEGELRSRASRMEPLDDLDALKASLRPLVERHLVVYLTAEDRRGALLSHGFHSKEELDRLIRHAAASVPAAPPVSPPHAAPPPAAPSVPPPPPRGDDRVPRLEAALDSLRQELATVRGQAQAAADRAAALEKEVVELRSSLRATQDEIRGLKQSLGG